MEVRWIFHFTEEEKKKFKELVPPKMWNNPFLQRMFWTNPKWFEILVRAKKRLKKEVI